MAKEYTDEEIELIKKYYPEKDGVNKLVELTGRTRQSIHSRGKRLGLTPYTTRDKENAGYRKEGNKYTDKQIKAKNDWVNNNYKRLNIAMSFDEFEALNEYCKKHNLSKNGFIRDIIKEKISEN